MVGLGPPRIHRDPSVIPWRCVCQPWIDAATCESFEDLGFLVSARFLGQRWILGQSRGRPKCRVAHSLLTAHMGQFLVSRWSVAALATVALTALTHCGGDAQSGLHDGPGGGGSRAGSGGAGQSGASGGTADSGGSSGTRVGDGGMGAVDSGCKPVLSQTGLDTGFETCDDGTKRRRASVMCPAPETSLADECPPCVGPYCCASDSDCTQEPHGICANAHRFEGACGCAYGCREDADCDPGSICECGSPLGVCRRATCSTNADCGAGLRCIETDPGVDRGGGQTCYLGVGNTFFACEVPADSCRSNADCSSGGCVLLDGRHVCVPGCPV